MTVHELLVIARNEIARGWVQNRLGRAEAGGVCARGGLMCGGSKARLEEGLGGEEARALVVASDLQLARFLPPGPAEGLSRVLADDIARYGEDWAKAICRLVDWNNAKGRTKAEVLDLFDRAISATAPEPDPERVYTSDDRVLFTTGPARVYIDGVRV